MNATSLRADLYGVLDKVLQTGKPVVIERRGRRLILCVDESQAVSDPTKTLWPKSRPQWVNGDVDSLADIDWSKEWRP